MSGLVGWVDWAEIGFMGCLAICLVMGWKHADKMRGSGSDRDLSAPYATIVFVISFIAMCFFGMEI